MPEILIFLSFYPHPRTFFHCFYRDRGRERGREREKHQYEISINQLPPLCSRTGDQTHNPGTCPDQELNPQPFSYRTILQPTEPHWPEILLLIVLKGVRPQ